jgi:hypothetical protein
MWFNWVIEYLAKYFLWISFKVEPNEINRRYKLLLQLLGEADTWQTNKVLIYKSILKPIWTYGIEIWGTTKSPNMKRIQYLRSKIIRKIASAPFYDVCNRLLHKDLNDSFVSDLATSSYKSFHSSIPWSKHLPLPTYIKTLLTCLDRPTDSCVLRMF